MAYCTITDVRALNPKRVYDAASKPTETQVNGYITQIAAEIDTVLLGRSLATPVTAPAEFVAHLKQVNAYGAAALAEMGMFPEQGGTASTPHGQKLWSMYKDAMSRLSKGSLPYSVQSGDPRSFHQQHTTAPADDDELFRQPKIKKDKVF